MARSAHRPYLRCLPPQFGHLLLFRSVLVGAGLCGSSLGRGQFVDLEAGFVHGWGAELVNNDRNQPTAVGKGWRVSAAYHFGAETATHVSLGVGWSTIYWDQKFHLVDWSDDWIYDRSGTMETRTGQVLLIPTLSVHLSKKVRLVIGADLGLNAQACRHETSSGTITWSGYTSHDGPRLVTSMWTVYMRTWNK
jgi:hypothetical protein